MIFPIDKVDAVQDPDERDDLINKILGALEPDDPPALSYLLVHVKTSNAVVQVMEALAKGRYPFKWRIQYLRDEFGGEPVPGGMVSREVPINRVKRNGDLVTPRALSLARQDGSYHGKYETTREYPIDLKGCFECGFEDAVYFLHNWGYNRKTKSAVTNKPEYSYEPVDLRDPSKGAKKHVRYWRYAEVSRADYPGLPEKKVKKGN